MNPIPSTKICLKLVKSNQQNKYKCIYAFMPTLESHPGESS